MLRTITARSISVAVLLAGLTACAGSRAVGSSAELLAVPAMSPNVITSKVIASAGVVPIEQLIADRVPGVQLDHSTDGRLSLRIRGTMSWWTNREPLYVVDGFPLMSAIGGAPMIFSSSDIERLEVLKDAASTAMYGDRGAGGVILIETKKR
jgi:TonB-dependent SusC/RagA subfamily outer membrane receptor